ncbi:TetR/AcrR family transcriptional regulator [Streptomyces sp. NBC_00059]|uniref:TetR/AcrR family transcriptional regulator n=1 Tax=Streptomyces sp. NBC_00059 TaxID=2975635 RepID=UPI00225C3B13|nr:TetR/AcrR family transcriptional regulator [Streptomyces sp. NBC_00059]MCX5417801.1 TetR/AcrR family transcriptional regulator [Streptomyces sp. NBC_00059]
MVRQERAVRTREALLRSAAEIFDTEGFMSASLSAISSRAGVSSGALHFHFVNKGALAEALEEAAERRLRLITGPDLGGDEWDGTGTPETPPADNPVQNLVATSGRLFDELNNDVVLRAGFILGCEPSWQSRVDLHGQWRNWIESALRQASDQGALADGTKPEDVVTVVAASTVGFEALGRKDPAWLSQERLDQFWHFMLPRLVPPGTGPQKET